MTQEVYEKQLLARIIDQKSEYYENADIIHSDLFQIHSDIYETFSSLVKAGRYPTLTKMISILPARKETFKDMMHSIDYGVPITELVSELDESFRVRFLNQSLTVAAMKPTSDEKVKAVTDAITGLYRSERAQFRDAYTAVKDVLKAAEHKPVMETPSGFVYFDTLTGGLQRSDLVILAAETSQGKTTLALNIAQNVTDRGGCVAVISLEMTERQIMNRMLAAKSEIPERKFSEQLEYIYNIASMYASSKLYLADVTNNSSTHILGLIRSAHIRHNVDVVIVDYLQLVSDKNHKSREQEIGQTARSLKNIAKELNINVIAISQLNRAGKGYNNYPTLSRLRDSGQVEEAADLVVFVYRPEYYGIREWDDGSSTENSAEIIIAKGRNYGTGKFRCRFQGEITKFSDFNHQERYELPERISTDHEDPPF